jgi:hypothetical protein
VNAATRYAVWGRSRVEGWFSRLDAEMFCSLITMQALAGLRGGAVEIGVHHGKSFIAICLCLRNGERGLAIDVFEDQHLNLDRSGKGNRAIFERNLRQFKVHNVEVLGRSSLYVTAQDIIERIGVPRFFSVDGGHWLEIVTSDLNLVESILPEGGILALDDVAHPDWPDVAAGFHRWYAGNPTFEPIALTQSKLYLARGSAAGYSDALRRRRAIATFYKKTTMFCGHTVDVYGPASGTRNRLRQIATARYPAALALLRRIRRLPTKPKSARNWPPTR